MSVAWENARPVRSISNANPHVAEPSYVGSQLELGFKDGAVVLLDPYLVMGYPHVAYSKSVVLAETGTTWKALRSPVLAAAVQGQAFQRPSLTTARVSADGTVTVRSGLATSPEVEITIAPQFGDDIGQGSPWSAFPVGRATVTGGEFVWKGKIALPPGYHVFHPVTGWWVYIDAVHSFEGQGNGEILNVGLPDGVLPDIPGAAVTSPADALAALSELYYPRGMPPVWPTLPGTHLVMWRDGNTGQVAHGTETATIIPDGTGYAVNITLTYGPAKSRRIYAVMWQVASDGDAMLTAEMGHRPLFMTPSWQ